MSGIVKVLDIFKTRDNSDKKSKVIIVGSSGVGKTSLRNRYVKGNFRNEIMTIGIEFDSADVDINGSNLKLELYDIAGQDAFQLEKKIVKNVQGVVIVFDLTRQETLFSVRSWVDKIFEISPKLKAPFIIVGNKRDLVAQRQIPADDVEKMIDIILQERHVTTKNMSFIETSAKTGYNTSETFQLLAYQILEIYYN